MELVERDPPLRQLEESLRRVAATGVGHCILLGGEAGIGKSSLLKEFARRSGEARLWWGACDALQTPHPLAPLHDIARTSSVDFDPELDDESRRAALFGAVLRNLERAPRPTLLVIEDVHWADDATLDLLRFLGRRIDRAPCLVALSYRDDELTPAHPLRRLLGDLPASFCTLIALQRLSAGAVETLARAAMRSAHGVHAATHGNPLFVTELLRQGASGVPRGVQDLVLARFARLSPEAQATVRLVSIVPSRTERWLVDVLRRSPVSVLEECLNSGLLAAGEGVLSFRHELARAAIEASLSAPVRESLHGEVLRALTDKASAPRSPPPTLARLVHHATNAADRDAILAYAPEAAREASKRGAHREAAAHYRSALAQAGAADVSSRRDWLTAHARECQLTDQLEEAIASRQQLAALLHLAGDPHAEAVNQSQLALVLVLALRNAEADQASQAAMAILEALAPSAALGAAYRVEAQLRMLDRQCEAAVAWGRKAMALAEQHDDAETLAAAIGTVGTATLFLDYESGCAQLAQALSLALANGSHYVAANAYSNLGSGSGEVFRLPEAHRYLVDAVGFSARYEIDFYRNYALAWLAMCEMFLGRWDDAAEHAQDVLQQSRHREAGRSTSRVMALTALGRVQARRGDPEAAATLEEALSLAQASGTLQRLAPVRAARAEAAWLRGDRHASAREAGAVLALAQSRRHPWFVGELAWWMHRAGELDAMPAPCAPPFESQARGDWRTAAAEWAALGCPYEQARALADGDTPARLEALAIFERLGARPALQRMRAALRAEGVPSVPRGSRPSTRTNPHQLTDREREVLALLCEGLRNSEIAERLCRSVRTVDHHLSAGFAKLGVNSRTEAVGAALKAGIIAAPRTPE